MTKEIIGYTTATTVLPKVDSGPDTNGHEYVDLGLPSGTLWATMNVGATSVTDYGNYYMYGMGTKTYDSADTPYDGTEDPLDLSKDTARVVWGGEWHMPTQTQLQELVDNTTYLWIEGYQGSEINGGLFTAQNNNSVFFPAAGNMLRIPEYGGGYSDELEGVGFGGIYKSSSPEYLMFLGDPDIKTIVQVPNSTSGDSVRPVIG